MEWLSAAGARLNIALPLIAGVLALAVFATADRTGWNEGYGYDGTLYGSVAEDFPGRVFGGDVVTAPGNAPDTDGEVLAQPGPIDAYYVKRIFPSGLVYATTGALGLSRTPENVVNVFAALTVVMVALVALLWCLSADLLRLTREQKLLGWMALILNFAALKASAYWPVTTDIFAYAEGTALLYFWARRSTVGVVVITCIGAFTWPTLLWVGAALLAFPREEGQLSGAGQPSGEPSQERGRPERKKVLLCAGIAVVFLLLLVRLSHFVTAGGTFGSPPLKELWSWGPYLLPLGMLISAAFVFWGALWLLPDLKRSDFGRLLRPLLGRRGLIAAGVLVGVLVAQELIARRSGVLSEPSLVKWSLPWSAAFPGLFLVTLIGYYGPLLAMAGWRWPAVTRALHAHGLGITLVAAAFLGSALLVESRKALPVYPLMVPFCVMALGDLRGRRRFMVGFAVVSLLASRFWLHIGHFEFGVGSLREFPAEAFFMATGLYTSWEMYAVQLAAIVAGSALLWRLKESPRHLA